MVETVKHIIGVMDPNYFSFRESFEGIMDFLNLKINYKNKIHEIVTRRIKSRPYNVLAAKTSCDAIINRGAHWNPHHNGFFTIIAHTTYLLNDMTSFKAINKNVSYGHMHLLGIKIPRTWAIPQEDYSELKKSEKVNPDLIFPDFELFDLEAIGNEVGYPAYLKPQDGGGWVGVEKVNNYEELHAAYKKSGDKPVNLQQAIEYKEFCRSVGIGPQVIPMHYNPNAKYSHDRYMRSPYQAVEHNFLTQEVEDEVKKICRIINAFYGWDHNSCEALITEDNEVYPIDFANAYPDSSITSLHYYFPEVIKAMVRWLVFVCVTGRKKPVNFSCDWDEYFKIAHQADQENWDYKDRINKLNEIAERYYDKKHFEEFCEEYLNKNDFEEKAFKFFASSRFEEIIIEKVKRYFKNVPHEIPEKIDHYVGIHQFWLKCEADRLGI